jgi:hypothetical protein
MNPGPPFKFCECGRKHLLPLPDPQHDERIRKEAVRNFIEYITRKTEDPYSIGRRMIYAKRTLLEQSNENQTELAQRLGVGKSVVSEALKETSRTLKDMKIKSE